MSNSKETTKKTKPAKIEKESNGSKNSSLQKTKTPSQSTETKESSLQKTKTSSQSKGTKESQNPALQKTKTPSNSKGSNDSSLQKTKTPSQSKEKEKEKGKESTMKTAKQIWEEKGPPPERTIIVTDDGQKWEAYAGKFYKVPAYGSFGDIRVDDSLLIIDPIHIIPGEKCRCGRPSTELEKIGIYTYGDYLQKCTIKGSASNPYGKHLKFASGKEGLAAVVRSYEKTSDLMTPVLFKKRSGNRVGDVIIRF
jgi:hypothetical protein